MPSEKSILSRRRIEADIVAPFVAGLTHVCDKEKVLTVLRQTIVTLARDHGRQMARTGGGNSLAHFYRTLDLWTMEGALEIELLEQSATRLDFDVKRCRYAEFYQAKGIPRLGAILSCSRDFALVEGFNPKITLRRTKTILAGDDHCDFRYACESQKC